MKQETQRILAALCLGAAQSAIAEDVIRAWVDQDGRTHYSNVIPTTPARHRPIQSAPAVDADEVARAQVRAAQAREQLERWRASRLVVEDTSGTGWVTCERALKMIEMLGEYEELPLLRPYDDGAVAPLTGADRLRYLHQARADIGARCDHARKVEWDAVWAGLFWPHTARAAHITPTMFIPPPMIIDPPVSLKRHAGTPVRPPSRPEQLGTTSTTPPAPTAGTLKSGTPSGGGAVRLQ